MLKKTVTYKNFNDEDVTETLYFNLNEMEITDWQYSNPDGLTMSEYLKKIYDIKDYAALYRIVKHFVLMSYGEKSADGKHFLKSDEIRKTFEMSAVFPVVFSEIMSSADNAAMFIKNCLPKRIVDAMPDSEDERAKLLKLANFNS